MRTLIHLFLCIASSSCSSPRRPFHSILLRFYPPWAHKLHLLGTHPQQSVRGEAEL
ncbi:hypothetical protein BD310DRAFT_935081 [Dichomitus squalens]|uniref:Uncharacterized protein n=1 Tax=Dichomitus squalens TaxID=114155 RepID=A0A4V2K754_9APHY|nr:hypothetical protein BD310DRAFT_935081 [Dichomitus squalens]